MGVGATTVAVLAPLVGKMLGGLFPASKPTTHTADPTATKELMAEDTLAGPYADLAATRDFKYGDTPWLDEQGRFGEQQQRDMEALLARSQGQNLISTQKGLEQQRALQASVMGQAASNRGTYNPAMQAAAQRHAAMLPSQMSAGIRGNEEAEKLAALQAYNYGVAQARGADEAAVAAWRQRQQIERQRQAEQEARRQAMMATEHQSHMTDVGVRSSTEAARTALRTKGIKVGKDPFTGDTPFSYTTPPAPAEEEEE